VLSRRKIAAKHYIWVLALCRFPYMVPIATGSATPPESSSQEGTRWNSGTAPQR